MKNFFLRFSGLICIAGLLVGCTPAPFDLNYKSNANITKVNPSISKKELYVSQARDLRNATPNQIATIKYFTYTQIGTKIQHSTTYSATQPIAEVLTSAIKENLSKAGYKITDNNHDLNLSVNLTDLTYNYNYLFFKETLTADIMLQFKLVNLQHNKTLWSHTYRGIGRLQSHTMMSAPTSPSSGKVKELFGKAVDNALEQFMSDSDFRNLLKS